MFNLSHLFNREKCLKDAEWIGDTLYCRKCKEPIASRYLFNEEVQVHPYERYQKYKREIDERKDTHTVANIGDYLGEVNFVDFDDFICDIRQLTSELLSVPEDGDGVCETGESEESTGTEEILTEEDEEYINDENPMKLGFDENLEIIGEG